MPRILTIQSEVVGARVGNGVARFALERLGVEAIALPTTLYGRRPDRGAPGGAVVEASTLRSLLAALAADGALDGVDAVLSGYLATAEHAEIVAEALALIRASNPAATYVCDPVMGDDGRAFVRDEVAAAMRHRLAPLADLLTPNLWELGALAGATDDVVAAARALGRATVVTSAPSKLGVGALFVGRDSTLFVETARVEGAPKGVGDLFAALFVGRRALGQSVGEALSLAAGAVCDVAALSVRLGSPHLAVVAGQALLAEPLTRPSARPYPSMDDRG